MRTRSTIINDLKYHPASGTYAETRLMEQNQVIIELLLDLRELLEQRVKQG